MKRKSGVVSALAALALGLVLSGCGPSTTVVGAVAEATPTTSVTADSTDPKVNEKVAQGVMVQLGFAKSGVKVGGSVDQNAAKKTPTGSGIFNKYLTTPAAVAGFLATGSPKAKLVMNEALQSAKNYGVVVTSAELTNQANWVAASTTDGVAWEGNTYLVGSTVKKAGGVRIDRPGSVVMIFIPPSQVKAGKVTWVFFVRGACTNPQTKPPRPVTPPPPGKPKCPPQYPHGHYPICKDGPDRDPQSNGNVPPVGTKDRPSDDNASEVARPPETPSDSGNGIPSGSSPRATPSPKPSSSAPPSGPGPTQLPAPTSTPQPGGPAPTQPPKTGTPSPPPP